ncbi:MAG: redoxin domain-containing protein [Proteobacteria bacterium]|nr:redoxin domain-containing protein [Pseudomonadota bacterium]MCP4919848.1 redoxin domain-containing protein [Pseudomonadota bacterium]
MSEAPEDVRVLAVMVDVTTENKAAKFAEQYDLSLEVLGDQDGLWLEEWGANGGTDQHSFTVVDSEGRVSWHKEGSTTADAIARKVDDAQ